MCQITTIKTCIAIACVFGGILSILETFVYHIFLDKVKAIYGERHHRTYYFLSDVVCACVTTLLFGGSMIIIVDHLVVYMASTLFVWLMVGAYVSMLCGQAINTWAHFRMNRSLKTIHPAVRRYLARCEGRSDSKETFTDLEKQLDAVALLRDIDGEGEYHDDVEKEEERCGTFPPPPQYSDYIDGSFVWTSEVFTTTQPLVETRST